MKVAIMQPYFLPYLGYFQLMRMADLFVIYDNIQYTKKGWINRNRFLANSGERTMTLPLKKDSDYLNINQRSISQSFEARKLLETIKQSYKRAPYRDTGLAILEEILEFDNPNLFSFIERSLHLLSRRLKLETQIIRSSDVKADHQLKGQERVLSICQALKASVYINPPGGKDLYSAESFRKRNISLRFLAPSLPRYTQTRPGFIPGLSILDVLMNCSLPQIREMLDQATSEEAS